MLCILHPLFEENKKTVRVRTRSQIKIMFSSKVSSKVSRNPGDSAREKLVNSSSRRGKSSSRLRESESASESERESERERERKS